MPQILAMKSFQLLSSRLPLHSLPPGDDDVCVGKSLMGNEMNGKDKVFIFMPENVMREATQSTIFSPPALTFRNLACFYASLNCCSTKSVTQRRFIVTNSSLSAEQRSTLLPAVALFLVVKERQIYIFPLPVKRFFPLLLDRRLTHINFRRDGLCIGW
jgi:hypothetical protein